MLTVKVPATEYYDEEKEEFVQVKAQTLTMEHSLISVSKWESIWKKPFLQSNNFTTEELISYYQCMTINAKVDPMVFYSIGEKELQRINDYIMDTKSATTFNQNGKQPGKKEVFTSELLYFYMIANNIPSEYEKWHLSRLLTLLRICSIKNNPKQKKMSPNAIRKQNKSLNAARRAKYHTRG